MAAANGNFKQCTICNGQYSKSYWHQHLLSKRHKTAVRSRGLDEGSIYADGVILHATMENTAYDVLFASTTEFRVADESVSLNQAFTTIELFFAHFKAGIIRRIEEGLSYHSSIKINLSLALILKKPDVSGDVMYTNSSLRTKTEIILLGTDLEKWFQSLVRVMLAKYENRPQRNSNWTLNSIEDLELHISKYIPLNGSSHIPLPQAIESKKAVINVQNFNDHRCFAYAMVTRSLYELEPKIKNLHRIGHYTEGRMRIFNFQDIRFPTPFSDITIFERNNDVAINVYSVDDEGKDKSLIYPIRVSDKMVDDIYHK